MNHVSTKHSRIVRWSRYFSVFRRRVAPEHSRGSLLATVLSREEKKGGYKQDRGRGCKWRFTITHASVVNARAGQRAEGTPARNATGVKCVHISGYTDR